MSGGRVTTSIRRKSEFKRLENRFFGWFFGFRGTIRSRITDLSACGWPYLELFSRFASSGSIRHSPQLPTFSRQNATVSRRDATFLRQDATLLRQNATVLSTFANVANSDLRQIAFRFLTMGVRVGDAVPESAFSSSHRFVVGIYRRIADRSSYARHNLQMNQRNFP